MNKDLDKKCKTCGYIAENKRWYYCPICGNTIDKNDKDKKIEKKELNTKNIISSIIFAIIVCIAFKFLSMLALTLGFFLTGIFSF